MIWLDVSLLIYVIDLDSAHHARARRWLEKLLSSDTWVGLPWMVSFAFVRITTRSAILTKPLSPTQAISYVGEWLAQPYVLVRNLLLANGTAGNLTSGRVAAALSEVKLSRLGAP